MAYHERTEIASQVREIVAQKLNRDKTSLQDTQTFQELGADSLDLVEIVMRLEEVFAIEINDADAEHLMTINDVVDYIQKLKTK